MKKLLAAVVFLSVPIWLTLGYVIHLATPEAATAEINPATSKRGKTPGTQVQHGLRTLPSLLFEPQISAVPGG